MVSLFGQRVWCVVCMFYFVLGGGVPYGGCHKCELCSVFCLLAYRVNIFQLFFVVDCGANTPMIFCLGNEQKPVGSGSFEGFHVQAIFDSKRGLCLILD